MPVLFVRMSFRVGTANETALQLLFMNIIMPFMEYFLKSSMAISALSSMVELENRDT